MHKLVILDSDSSFREVQAGRGELVIGRAPDGAVVLRDRSVSRRHAVVRQTDAGLTLVDAGSSGGTFVNERRLEPGEELVLRDGDIVRLGAVRMLCHSDGERDREQATRDAAFAAQANARILVLEGDLLRRRPIASPATLLGSAAHCLVRLTDRSVPPEQALIRAVDGAFRVEPRSRDALPLLGSAQAPVTEPRPLPSNSTLGIGGAQVLFLYDYEADGTPVRDPLSRLPRRRLLRHVATQLGVQRRELRRLCRHRKPLGQCLGEILVEAGMATPLFWSVLCDRLRGDEAAPHRDSTS